MTLSAFQTRAIAAAHLALSLGLAVAGVAVSLLHAVH
jgi:hypothetical protein